MSEDVKVISYTGEKVQDFIPDIAKLRIEVFAEYPFLYAGDYAYEQRYLKKFMTIENAIVVAAFDKNTLIGVSTGYPFIYEIQALQDVFKQAGKNPEDYFCYGESVLKKSYRGQGIGKKFHEHREEHMKKLGCYKHICFYTSMRPLDDPRKPNDHRSLAPFWRSRGFKEHPELIGTVSYQEIGEQEESPKKMIFWIKDL